MYIIGCAEPVQQVICAVKVIGIFLLYTIALTKARSQSLVQLALEVP